MAFRTKRSVSGLWLQVAAPEFGTIDTTGFNSSVANSIEFVTGGTVRGTVNNTGMAVTNLIATTLNLPDIGTVAATGSTIADAGAITTTVTLVTAADGTKGVILPVGTVGDVYVVANGAASALKVYPQVNSTVNGLAANANVSVAASKGAVFVKYNTTAWGAAYG